MTAGVYRAIRAQLGSARAGRPRIAVGHVQGVSLEHVQTMSVVWCAAVAASLSATPMYDPLVFRGPSEGSGVALALRDRPRVRRDRKFVEMRQGLVQQVAL